MHQNYPTQRRDSHVLPIIDGELLFGGVSSLELQACIRGRQIGQPTPEKAPRQNKADVGLEIELLHAVTARTHGT